VVHLNDKYSSSADNRGTTCHELGHALGLGHNSSTGSCLYASAVSGTDPQYPNSNDYNTLRYKIYP
jgi:predicted Zn-dependent protease